MVKYLAAVAGLVAALLSPTYRDVIMGTLGVSERWAIGLAPLAAGLPVFLLRRALRSDLEFDREFEMNRPAHNDPDYPLFSNPTADRATALGIGIVSFWFQVYLIWKCFRQS